MCTKDGSKLLEYNVRLGDPETQAVLPLMQSDFVELCEAILDQSLVSFSLEWKKGAVCAPVLVSGGYPVAYKKGFAIVIDEKLMQARDVKIFISGGEIAAAVSVEAASSPSAQQGKLVTSGGRVLTVSAFAPQADTAWERAYNAIGGISFDKMYYRTDIGRL
jgi:phosphoribosylamine--glycine ligase